MQQESTQHNNRSAQSQRHPKDNIHNRTTHRERKDNNENCTRTQYGGFMKKPDWLKYS